MDFEKFEKNNRFQLLRNKILRISDGDLVKKRLNLRINAIKCNCLYFRNYKIFLG